MSRTDSQRGDRVEMGSAPSSLSRRAFLARTSLACAAPAFMPSSMLGAAGAPPPSERINVGLIGLGVMGSGHLNVLLNWKEVQLLAVCEVDRGRRDEGRQKAEAAYATRRTSGSFKGCQDYNDYREMLARPDIDAVVIVTPDHWHALMAIEAARAGKDVYCEKPVSLTLSEGRELVQAVRRYARVFQNGSQYRSIPTIHRVCEFVRNGGLGKVSSAFTLWRETGVPEYGPSLIPLDPHLPAEPVPQGLDWDRWVGPAPWHPYHHLYHRNPRPGVVPWSFCDAFGAGAITGYHSHAADVIQYAIGMETTGPVEIIHPSSGRFPTLTCRYANGTLLHHLENWDQAKTLYQAVPNHARLAGMFGGLFVGERGWLTSNTGAGPIEGGPEEVLRELALPSREVTSGANTHHANWFECIRTRRRPSSHEEIGHRSASLGHLVALSHKLGRSLKWDPENEEFTGDETANRLRARAMREPWQI